MLVVKSITDSHPEIGCHRDPFSSDSIPTSHFSRVECLGLRIERIIVLENSIDFWSTLNLIIFLILTGVYIHRVLIAIGNANVLIFEVSCVGSTGHFHFVFLLQATTMIL